MDEKDTLLNEWAEKIYRAAETAWKTLVAFLIFPEKEESEKFRNTMHGKNFGKFVSVFQNNAGILYPKIGNYEMGIDYHPKHYHVEKIANFLAEQKEKGIDAAQQILMQIATVPIVARMARGKILYPEIEEMEKEIADLKEKIKELTGDLKISLDTWAYFIKGIESDISHSIHLFYALKNKYK